MTGIVGYHGYRETTELKSLWCDAEIIGILEITDQGDLETMTFPNLLTIEGLTITNAGNLKRIYAPKLRAISHLLSLTNVTQLPDFNISGPNIRFLDNEISLNI